MHLCMHKELSEYLKRRRNSHMQYNYERNGYDQSK